MNDNEDMDAPVTRMELREELSQFATKADLARFEGIVLGLADQMIAMGRRHEADLQRLHVELLRFIQSSMEGGRRS